MARFTDVSDTTVTAAEVPAGKYFYDANGVRTEGEMADYVKSQGTSGIWTWRVWNSGIAECWGQTATATYNSWTLWNNHVYYTASTLGGDAYPSGLFSGNSSVHCSMEFIPTVNDVWLGYHRDGDNRFTPTAYLYKATNASASGFIRYSARGVVDSSWSG